MAWILPVLAFSLAVFIGTFVEYWGHRLMHIGKVLRKKHAQHHTRGWGQGWLLEFRDYGLPSLSVMWVGFLHSPLVGVAFFSGGLFYAAFAAYAHQLQHERPNQMFWLKQPVHAVHHYHQEWHHNFGITVDFWDRVFGTYREHAPIQAFADLEDGTGLLGIHWASTSDPLPTQARPEGPGL